MTGRGGITSYSRRAMSTAPPSRQCRHRSARSFRRPSGRHVPRRAGDLDDRRHAAGRRPGQARVRHHRQHARPRSTRPRRVHAGIAAVAVSPARSPTGSTTGTSRRSPSPWRSASHWCCVCTPPPHRRAPCRLGLATLFGTVRAFGVPAMRADPAADRGRGRAARLIALYAATWQIGMIVGPASSGLLYDIDPAVPYLAAAIGAGLAAIASLAITLSACRNSAHRRSRRRHCTTPSRAALHSPPADPARRHLARPVRRAVRRRRRAPARRSPRTDWAWAPSGSAGCGPPAASAPPR